MAPVNARRIRIERSRGGRRCPTDARGARRAPSRSTTTARASGWPSGAARTVCVGSTLDPVLEFDASGKLVTHFGAGIMVVAARHHDRSRRQRVGRRLRLHSAAAAARPARTPTKGHQIFKFSPDGQAADDAGQRRAARATRTISFSRTPCSSRRTATSSWPKGHSSAPGSVARVFKFSKDGKLIKSWGSLGSGPDDFDQPHALAMDSRGRLFVGDRGNNRIKIFDQDGKLLDTWYQFSRPSGIFIDARDNIYVADSESGSVNPRAWRLEARHTNRQRERRHGHRVHSRSGRESAEHERGRGGRGRRERRDLRSRGWAEGVEALRTTVRTARIVRAVPAVRITVRAAPAR